MGAKRSALLATIAASIAAILLPPATASADQTLKVTFAARYCHAYTDVTANRARNNIQESLQDLGPDTPYGPDDLVDATTEDTVQPNCKPLDDWQFTLGDGIAGAVAGPWGSLSIVSNQFPTSVVTKSSVPLLNTQGQDTGKNLKGATTVTLTGTEADLAARGALWLQGGTPADPSLYTPFAGAYGFAALRCATDNYNGDNVEYINVPSGSSHVFCFAYYVTPPPTAGTIIIRKEVVGQPAGGDPETFTFGGNVSYVPGGVFELTASDGNPGSETFNRGATATGDDPWRVTETALPANWTLDNLTCETALGTSTVAPGPLADGTADITLAAGDTVTCTYTNRYVPPKGNLEIRKITRGAIGTFGYEIDPLGGGKTRNVHITTKRRNVAAAGPVLNLDPGRYRITESSPRAAAGRWSNVGIECDGKDAGTDPITVTVTAGGSLVCTYTNRFRPRGSLRVRVVTIGGTGTVGYQVHGPRTDSRKPIVGFLVGHTKKPGHPARARGTNLSSIPLGSYSIRQGQFLAGNWTLVAVLCRGKLVPFDQGGIDVRLTRRHPHAGCTFINHPDPTPPEPEPAPRPPPAPVPGPDGDNANITLTKTPTRTTIRLGQNAEYRLQVKNKGPGVAYDVVVNERTFDTSSGFKLISLRSSRGTCGTLTLASGRRTPYCEIGDLLPGGKAVLHAVTVPQRTGPFHNSAVAGTSSEGGGHPVANADIKVIKPRHHRPPPPPPPNPVCRAVIAHRC